MGWSFSMNRSQTKADFVAELNSDRTFSPGYHVLKHRVVGNHLWQLIARPDGTKTISLFLMSRGNGRHGRGCSDHGWGHKGLSEDMGPCEHDCPLSLLNEADPPESKYASDWREEVRQFHAAKKQRPKPAPDKVVKYGDRTFRLVRPYAPRRGWVADCIDDGVRYRLNAQQLAQAAYVDSREQA